MSDLSVFTAKRYKQIASLHYKLELVIIKFTNYDHYV